MPDGAPSLALDAFLIITPPAGALPGGIQLTGAPSPDPQDAGGVAIEVAAFEFGIASATTIGTAAGEAGAGAGKVRNSPFTVTKAVDSLSPSLLALVGAGVRFARMELYLRYPPRAGGVGQHESAESPGPWREGAPPAGGPDEP